MMKNRPLVAAAIVVLAGVGFLAWTFLSGPQVAEQSEIIESLESVPAPTSSTPTQEPATEQSELQAADDSPEEDFPALVDNALRNVDERQIPIDVGLEVVETFDHDTSAFTQGFELSDGRLFESTGLVGQSTIRELDPATGEVLRSAPVPDLFAEGLTVIEDPAGSTVIQITWQDEVAFRYDLETFEVLESFTYSGQGWGICHNEERLVMSDGTDRIQFRDPDTFELLGGVNVTLSDVPVQLINELECVGDAVWANIWMSSLIIQIDPSTGNVTRVLNANELIPDVAIGSNSDVLNGIAYDAADNTYLLTGKRWPVTYRVQLFDDPATN